MPSTLSLLTNVFPADERPKAIAIWAGLSGAGGAIGPVASGILIEHFYWGSVFLVNVPIILVSLVAGKLLLPTSRDPEEAPLDIPGAALSIAGLGTLVYGIIEGPNHGWLAGRTLGIFAVSIVALALFGWREVTARHPMLDLRFFRDRRFSVASGGMTLIFFAMFGTFFLVAQYLQLVLGYSALEAGLFQLPFAVVMMAISPQVPKLVARYGVAGIVPKGLALVAVGLFTFSFMGVDTPLWVIYGPILFLAAGMALTMSPMTTLIMSAVPLGKAGVGSAMNDTTRELGGALGVAVLGSLVTSAYASSIAGTTSGLPAAEQAEASGGLVGAYRVAEGLGAAGGRLVDAANHAFVDGLGLAATVGSVIVLGAAIASWRLLPRPHTAEAVALDVDAGADPAELLELATADV
jgi:EmrB/QacA subfamily drug resistance transporter